MFYYCISFVLLTLSYFGFAGIFRPNSFFISASIRKAVAEGRADTIPIFLSEIPLLFRRRLLNLDVAMISVSPIDNHGFCSLGPGVDCTRAAVQNAQFIIGLNNNPLSNIIYKNLAVLSLCIFKMNQVKKY